MVYFSLYRGYEKVSAKERLFSSHFRRNNESETLSNEKTVLAIADKIWIPYISKEGERLGKTEQRALLIVDVFRGH